MRIDGPKPHGPRKIGRTVILLQPQDHGRAVTGRGVDRRPAAALGCSRHGGLDLPGYCDVCMSVEDLAGAWMSDPKAELHIRINHVDAELDRFEEQAAVILAVIVLLSLAGYLILLQMTP